MGRTGNDNQITGNTGMYYVCYQLSKKGWNVMPTARNAKGIDILAYTPDGRDFLGIQVKTLSHKYPIPLGKSQDDIMGDFWAVAVLSESKTQLQSTPTVYIFTPDEIKSISHPSGKENKITWWVNPKDYNTEEYKERWDKILNYTSQKK